MKTTVEIQDALFEQAKRYAKRSRRSLRAIIEEGLRRVLTDTQPASRFELPDASVGDPDGTDPLEAMSWQDLRAEIYREPPGR